MVFINKNICNYVKFFGLEKDNRGIILKARIASHKKSLIHFIYGLSKQEDKLNFWNSTINRKMCGYEHIFIGDLNIICSDEMDVCRVDSSNKRRKDEKVIEVINNNLLVDVFRETKFNKKVYSYFKTNNITKKIYYKSRIGNVLTTDTFRDMNHVEYKKANSSSPDYCPITLSIRMEEILEKSSTNDIIDNSNTTKSTKINMRR